MSRPRIGFLGTGWIGRDRMAAICATGAVEAVAVSDPSAECAAQAQEIAPAAVALPSLDAMLDLGLDGVVIATPSALHADQAIAALEAGCAVFCQKPLGRTAAEARAVVAAARAADRLLGVDFSYRRTAAVEALAALVRNGALGEVFRADLVFHDAYGPDKPWFYDRAQSGGGCVMDLGVHLIDLLLWLLDFPALDQVSARLHGGGRLLRSDPQEIEDYATAELGLGGVSARLACSWNLNAGQEAVIAATFYGSKGGAAVRNVAGSFYDFEAVRFAGTSTERLVAPPDAWGGRVAADWAVRLAGARGFDPAAERFAAVSEVVDRIYAAA